VSVTAKDLSIVDGAEGTYVAGSPVVGPAGASLPASVALVVSWKEFASYRGGHPRTYLFGIPAAVQTDPQHVTGTFATNVQTDANAFIADIASQTWPAAMGDGNLVVVHYSLKGYTGTLPFSAEIGAATVDTQIDSQRRRLKA
jgi:hypothetical protein